MQGSAVEAGAIAGFLHENYARFTDAARVEEAADAAAYLSDAGAGLGAASRNRPSSRACLVVCHAALGPQSQQHAATRHAPVKP